jgi:hypothetical protein
MHSKQKLNISFTNISSNENHLVYKYEVVGNGLVIERGEIETSKNGSWRMLVNDFIRFTEEPKKGLLQAGKA